MSENTLDLAPWIEPTARLLDLSIAPDYLPQVAKNLNALAEIASLVTEFELAEDLEAAPTFNP